MKVSLLLTGANLHELGWFPAYHIHPNLISVNPAMTRLIPVNFSNLGLSPGGSLGQER